MNLSFRLINPQANRSFIFKWEAFGLTTPWHYHPELELIYFVEGKTNAIIGDGFREFEVGDLVLLGSNFPHVLKENPPFKEAYPSILPFGLIIQFVENFLGNDFLNKPEMQSLKHLFERANRGLLFKKNVVKALEKTLKNMHTLPDNRKLTTLLDILFTLAETTDYEYMTNQDYYFHVHDDEERMGRINQYVYENFADKITIANVAAVANMTETAFCRYFKSRTLKNFTLFLNEVRIAYACKLLQKKDMSVTNACFQSGFNSLSYFNRQFKSIISETPQRYRQKY
jgi:AraC-like DNA-binding protein